MKGNVDIVTDVNCLVFNLSLLHPGNYGVHEYRVIGSETDRKITATQTNLAQSMYIFELLFAEEKIIDNAIVLLTDECLTKTEIPELNGLNTYEYYISEMKKFVNGNEQMRKLIIEKSNCSTIDDYFDKAFATIKISSKGLLNKELRSEIFKTLQQSVLFSQSAHQNIYMDVTGGHRVSSWLLMCISRIIEARKNSEVKLALYGDILRKKDKLSDKMIDDAEIVDCTEAYKEFYTLEKLSKSNDAMCRYSALSEAGYIDELDKEAQVYLKKLDNLINRIDKMTKHSSIPAQMKQLEKELKDDMIETLDNFIQIIIKDNKSNMLNRVSENPFEKMMGFSDENLIVNFYENAFDIFVDYGVILADGRILDENDLVKDQKEQVKYAFLANKHYYKHYNKKGTVHYGLVKTIQSWINDLMKCDDNPLEFFAKKVSITNCEYKEWNGRSLPVSADGAELFKSYVEKEKIDFKGEYLKEGSDIFEVINSYLKMQNYYLSYGFPFQCVNEKGFVYPEIYTNYYNKVYAFMTSLSNLKRKSLIKYKSRLNELKRSERLIEREIPCATSFGLWKVNSLFFESEKKMNEFFISFNRKLEEVRPYRNALVHNGELTFKKSEVDLANEIRTLLMEYVHIIEKSKDKGERNE